MKYCVDCGEQVTRRWVPADRRDRYVCDACGTTHYENPKVLVLCMAHWNQRLVLCRRAQAPARGLWSPPAGFLEMNESLEQAAARETFEEAGFELDPQCLQLYFVAGLPHMNQVYVGFQIQLRQVPKLRAGSESLEVALLSERELPEDRLAFGPTLKDYYRTFFEHLRSRQFPVMSLRSWSQPARAPGLSLVRHSPSASSAAKATG